MPRRFCGDQTLASERIMEKHEGTARLATLERDRLPAGWEEAQTCCAMRFERLDVLSQVALVATWRAGVPRLKKNTADGTGLVMVLCVAGDAQSAFLVEP